MSGYRQGHDQGHENPYINYGAEEGHPEERVFGSHQQSIQQSGHGLNIIHDPLGQHHPHQPPQGQQPIPHVQHVQEQHPPQSLFDPPDMAHQHPSHFPGAQGMMYDPRQMQQSVGTKRPRPESVVDLEIGDLPQQSHIQHGMGGMGTHMAQSSMGEYGVPHQTQQGTQTFHNHPLPQVHPDKRRRTDDPDSSIVSTGASSMVGQPGMPSPAPMPRGPKLKFTPEDDQKLVDLKENKSMTWKQIAEFFPGRSSGTLQVRYCTKLKAKTTQWTDETVQKLRQALHDYEQEKWRIIAQKVGTGFTSAACKEKAEDLEAGVL